MKPNLIEEKKRRQHPMDNGQWTMDHNRKRKKKNNNHNPNLEKLKYKYKFNIQHSKRKTTF